MTAEDFISTVRGLVAAVSGVHERSAATRVPTDLKTATADFARSSTPPRLWPASSAGSGSHAEPRYQRCLLNAPSDPFQIVLSAWAPHSSSPIHDHARIPGVVAALWGTPMERKYTSLQHDPERVELTAGSLIALNAGAVSDILDDPAGQVHQIVNRSAEWAFTVHVYLRRLERYRLYRLSPDGSYSFIEQRLWFDATHYWKVWDHPCPRTNEAHVATG